MGKVGTAMQNGNTVPYWHATHETIGRAADWPAPGALKRYIPLAEHPDVTDTRSVKTFIGQSDLPFNLLIIE